MAAEEQSPQVPAPPPPARVPEPDDNHEVVGWDAAPEGKDFAWRVEAAAAVAGKPRRSHRLFWVGLGVMLILLGFLMLVGSNLLVSKIDMLETTAQDYLHALVSAQNQYHKKHDVFAASGNDLNRDVRLIFDDLKNTCDTWQQNGDQQVPQPKWGYFFRMLQGDQRRGVVAWRIAPDDPAKGMTDWAVICRAAEPFTSGDHQYLMTSRGELFEHDEPLSGPGYKKFLLDSLPTRLPPNDDQVDVDWLLAHGWRLLR